MKTKSPRHKNIFRHKLKEWLARYLIAEILGTVLAVGFATYSYHHTHSYILAAGTGFVGEGIGFYGYFVIHELLLNNQTYRELPFLKRLTAILANSSRNLIVEFAPAEIIDNIFIRPFLMFYLPQHLHPFALGFLVAKLSADVLFYALAVVGYELNKRLSKPKLVPKK